MEDMFKNERQEQHSRVPSEFLKGIFIVPHNFINPDNPEHGEFVNEQMRVDLFQDTYAKIADIEMQSLKNEDDFIKLKQINECEKNSDSVLEKIFTHFRKEKSDEMIRCEKWTLNLNDQSEIQYKVKFYQSELDRFYALVFPPTLHKYYSLYQTNRSFI